MSCDRASAEPWGAPLAGPQTWADVPSLSPWGRERGVWRLHPGETCHSAKATPASLLLPSLSSVLPSSAFIPVFSLPHPALCPVRCQKGPVSVPWQRQRLAAPAASAVSLDFVCGARGPGRAVRTHAGTARRLREGMPWAGAGPTPRGTTWRPWKSLARAMDVLEVSRGEKAWWGQRDHGLLAPGARRGARQRRGGCRGFRPGPRAWRRPEALHGR